MPKRKNDPAKGPAEARKSRLADQLRQNLLRRKAQSRKRSEPAKGSNSQFDNNRV